MQAAAEGKAQCHKAFPQDGTEENVTQFQQTKPPGRLIINTEVHPCLKRACVALGSIHQTRLKNMHSKGTEHQAHMEAYENESKEGKPDMINGKLEYMMETESKTAGLTEKKFREWRKTEKLEPLKRNGRGRSVSKRRKGREQTQGKTAREESAERQDKRRQQEEEKRRQEKNEKHLKEKEIQREMWKERQENKREENNKESNWEGQKLGEEARQRLDGWGQAMERERNERAERKRAEQRIKEREDKERERREDEEEQKNEKNKNKKTYIGERE